jgi:hypothetical protein
MAASAPIRKYATKPGHWGVVEYAIALNGKCDSEKFFHVEIVRKFGKTLGENLQFKLMAIFEVISNYGNSPKMSLERKPIHGIKLEYKKSLVRIACFQQGRSWVLTNGFFKPGAQKGLGAWPTEELDRADRIMNEHIKRITRR